MTTTQLATSMSADYSEDALVEQPAIALFAELGYSTANGFGEKVGGPDATFGRETTSDVILWPRLKAALAKLNSGVPADAIQLAVDELARDRSAMGLANANRDVYRLLKDGVKVTFQNDDGEEVDETLRVIDWTDPTNNDFSLVSQFWVSGPIYKRRADLIGFVNGLPLLFVELKKSHGKLEHAFKHNLKDYKGTIPQLFWFNAVIILSNGGQAKIGSMTAGWEHFADWKRINTEGEQGGISLETVIRGTCDKARFLDLVENFSLFDESKGGLVKVTAKNHQFLGVNNAVAALHKIKANQGRLGVFWHTQGSGKSLSMAFFSQKVLRKIPGNWTFLVITDREELDNQIYGSFSNCGVTTEECQADSGEHLRQLLTEDHRFVFTLNSEVRHEEGAEVPQAVGSQRHHRDDRRSSPVAIRHAGPQHAERPAERRLHRVHRNAADGWGREDQGSLRRLRFDLQLPPVHRRRGDGSAVLRKPHSRTATGERAFQGRLGRLDRSRRIE